MVLTLVIRSLKLHRTSKTLKATLGSRLKKKNEWTLSNNSKTARCSSLKIPKLFLSCMLGGLIKDISYVLQGFRKLGMGIKIIGKGVFRSIVACGEKGEFHFCY